MMEIARGRWDPDKFDGPMLKGHGYLEKEFMRTVFPQLQAWSDLWTSRLGRDISHAVFDSKGPFDTSQIGQGISVHFREETDWIIHSPGRP
jgi:hypothetical protein